MSDMDLTTDEGFSAFMRQQEARAGGEQPESQDGGEAAGQEGQSAPPDAGAAPPAGEEDTKPSPDFEAGYNKALGEQSEKLGEERAKREALEQRLAALEQRQSEGEEDDLSFEPITEQTWEELEGLYEAQGGPGMMLALANAGVSDAKIDAAIALWKENDFRNADLYEKQMYRLLEQAQAENAPAAKPDPDVAALKARTANEDAQREILSTYGREKLELIQPHLKTALEKAPKRLQETLAEDFGSSDRERIVDAFGVLVTLAEPLAATAPEGDKQPATSAAAKIAAQAATGSRQVGAGESGDLPTTREELEALSPEDRKLAASKIMAQRLLAQETSVARELERSHKSQ